MLPGNYVKHIWLLVPSGQAFAAQSQLQSQLGMAVCIPSTKLRNAEAWMLPTMWAGYSKPAQQQGKTFLAIFSIVYKVNFCLQDRQLSAFYNAHSWYLHLLCGPDYRSQSTEQSIWHRGPDAKVIPRVSQGVLLWTNPVDWTALSSSREVLEHFFALAPCIMKPPHDLWGCSAKATKLKQVGIAKLKVCFRP